MFDELSAIQSRLAEVQERIAALSPPAPVTASTPQAGDFRAALIQAQSSPALLPTGGPIGRGSDEMTRINGQTIHVPPASLGPLPAMPVAPDLVVPLPASGGTGPYGALIQTYAEKHGLPPSLVKAVIQTESGGNPRAVSRAGAMGLMQLMPANVREAGIQDPYDPEQNIAAGTRQLAGLMQQFHGDLDLALAGYNAGPGNVRKYGGVPPFPETQHYIRKIRAAMEHG